MKQTNASFEAVRLGNLESAKKALRFTEQKTSHLQSAFQALKNTIEGNVKDCNDASNHLDILHKETIEVRESSKYGNDQQKWKNDLIACVTEIESLLRMKQYLLALHQMQSHSFKIKASLKENNVQSAIDYALKLANQIKALSTSKCNHLLNYGSDCLLNWHGEIKGQVSKALILALKDLNWPVVAVIKDCLDAQGKGKKEKLQELKQEADLVKLLCELESKMKLCGILVSSCILENLIAPFKERFLFHFYGDKATNAIDKPEWFLSQTLKWMHDHVPMIERVISHCLPASEGNQSKMFSIQDQFVMSLIEMCADKIEVTMKVIVSNDTNLTDDHLLGHWIDEVLSFECEVKEAYPTLTSKLPCLKIFTRREYLSSWLELEKHHLDEDMTMFLESPNSWDTRTTDEPSSSTFKVPLCVTSFITDLLLMSERFGQIADKEIHSHFDRVQVHALNRFINRIEESCNENNKKLMSVVNGLNYIRAVVEDWTETRMFDIEQEIETCGESGSVWDNLVIRLDELIHVTLKLLVAQAEYEIVEALKTYHNTKWHNFESPKEFVVRVLSPPGCHLVITLKHHLNMFYCGLAARLFTQVFKEIIYNLDSAITDQFVMKAKFNEGGAMQFRFDMQENLFVLFTLWGISEEKGKRFMKRTNECSLLLNQLPGTGALLIDMISTCSKTNHKRADCCQRLETVLKDNSIVLLSHLQVKSVLQCRIDWPHV